MDAATICHDAGEPGNSFKTAYSYLQQHAPDAQNWYIGVANHDLPVNKIYWQTTEGAYQLKTLDAMTGKELTLSATQGGDFSITFIFSYMAYLIPLAV